MRAPLKRQCELPAEAYERHRREREDERKKLERVEQDSAHVTEKAARTRGTAAGDYWKLRGLPVQARGVGGTCPGTNPWAALMQKQPHEE